jgi:putative phage-type endonuclease
MELMTYTLLPDYPQDSPEWHEARRSSLGASEVAAVLGLTPSTWNASPRTVWLAKQGIPNQIDENLAYFGHALEPVVAGWVRDKHPEIGLVTNGISIRSNEYPWLTASPDRMIDKVGMLVPLEIKSSSAYSRDHWADGVPAYYQIQSIVQQGCLGVDHGYLAVLHGGTSPELYKIPFDPTVWEQVTRLTGDWFEKYVVGEVEPPPATMFEMESEKENTDRMIDGDERLLHTWYLDGLARSAYKDAESDIEIIKTAFKELLSINGADGLTFGGKPLYSWRRSKSVLSFDRNAFERDHPELVERYTRLVPGSMRFLRKTVREFENDPPAGFEPGTSVADVLAAYEELTLWHNHGVN